MITLSHVEKHAADHSLKTKAMHGAMWYGGSRVIIQALMWLMTLVVARLLTKTDYGLFGMALMYTAFVDLLNELGFGVAIVQKKEIHEEDLHTLFWFGLAIGGLFYGMTVLLAPVVASFFKQPMLVNLLMLLGLNFVVSSVCTVPWNILTRAVDFKKRAMAEVLGNMAGAVCTLILAYRGWGVWALAWGMLVRNTAITAQVYWQTRWHPRLCFKWARLRSVLSFSLHVVVQRFMWVMNENSASFIIGKLLGENALGVYSLAYRFTVDLSGRSLAMINQVAFPVYSRLQHEPERFQSYYLKVGKIMFSVNAAVLVGMMLVADDLIPLVLTEKWRDAVPVIQLLCPVGLLMTINGVCYPTWVASGKAYLATRFNLLCLLVMPASFFIGAKFGVTGVCWGWILGFPVLIAIGVTITRRIVGYHWREFWGMIKPAVVASLAMIVVGYSVKHYMLASLSPLARVAIITPLGAVMYIGVIIAVSPSIIGQVTAIARSVMAKKAPPAAGTVNG